jgi:predicted transcriptional regulator
VGRDVKTASDFLSTRVVTVGPEQRLTDVADAIAKKDALYCAVVDKSGRFIGLVRLKEIVARSADRIFSDLAPASLPLDINEKMEASLVVKLLQSQGCDEVVVLTSGKRYVGLATRESMFEWWARETEGL